MRLLHISDLHLGKRVNEYSMLEDQKDILKKIIDIADQEKAEGILIARLPMALSGCSLQRIS